jgi:pimeloyl-ACP methyl ester carboxylesterase
VFTSFIARARTEYEQLSPTPTEYDSFLAAITRMWETQPNWTGDDLVGIKVPTWIVDADHDEAIKRENTLFMADHIPDSGLLIEPQVSHFAFLQDPEQFNVDVLHFLNHAPGK